MDTQPRFPTLGTYSPPRSPRFPRNHRHLPVRGEPARSPRRACPEPVEGAVSNHPCDAATKPILTPPSRRPQPGPSRNQHPRPTAAPRQPVLPANRPLASQPAHSALSEPPPQPPRIGQNPTPRALKSFLEKTLTRAQHPGVLVQNPAVLAHPSSRRLQPGPSGNQQARVSVPPRQSRVPSLTVS